MLKIDSTAEKVEAGMRLEVCSVPVNWGSEMGAGKRIIS